MKFKSIKAYEILASGGYPTVEVEITLDSGHIGVASVPYGASAGSHEATVLLDEDSSRYEGNGMLKAINNIKTEIFPTIFDMNPEDQIAIDRKMCELDGTPNKARLGGNAILAVSLAVARAVSNAKGIELFHYIIDTYKTGVDLTKLPNPMVVVVEGGKHADETTDIQEFCITAIGEGSVKENVRKAMEAYHQLKIVLKENGLNTNVGNEGAFAPNGIPKNESPINYILQAIQKAGYVAGKDLAISIDAASSEFYDGAKYNLSIDKLSLSSEELNAYFEEWLKKYPIVTIEDMLQEDDWDNWVKLNAICKKYNVDLIGDDLTVTNVIRLQKAIDLGAISSILIKLNQIGSLTETVECCMLANKNGLSTVTSHRGGGETNDTAMIDVAVAVGSRFVKVGPTRGERVSKYNRLMQIESLVNSN